MCTRRTQRLGRRIEAFDPEVVFQFSRDHYNGFFYDLMPPFCMGVKASAMGDYGTHSGPLNVPETSRWERMPRRPGRMSTRRCPIAWWWTKGSRSSGRSRSARAVRYPIVPIFINCAAAPLPKFSRVRALGEAVGRYAKGLGKRVLFVGSGGLSHDPPLPRAPRQPTPRGANS